MTLRAYLILMSIGTFLCWLAWFFIIWSTDPNTAGLFSLAFFYFSFWLAMVGSYSVVGFLVRRAIIKNDDVVFRHVKRTFRQGIIIASTCTLILILLSLHLLTWWNLILLLCLVTFLEIIIFTNRKYSNTEYVQ